MSVFPIQVAARRAGLSQNTLRAWERRYEGISPERDSRGRRLYSDELVSKLMLLSELTSAGYRIGEIAGLSHAELEQRVNALQLGGKREAERHNGREGEHEAVRRAADAVGVLDDAGLQTIVDEVAASVGRLELVDGFIFPLVQFVEERMADGAYRELHLSFLSCTLRTALSKLLFYDVRQDNRPIAVLGVPFGQSGDLGIVASAIHTDAAGWRPLLIGTDIRAEQFVSALETTGAEAAVVGLSAHGYSLQVVNEVSRIRRGVSERLSPQLPVFFGGRVPDSLVTDLVAAGLRYVSNMSDLRAALQAYVPSGDPD